MNGGFILFITASFNCTDMITETLIIQEDHPYAHRTSKTEDIPVLLKKKRVD